MGGKVRDIFVPIAHRVPWGHLSGVITGLEIYLVAEICRKEPNGASRDNIASVVPEVAEA